MDRLSSCYFCGAALDASLKEYPVVPKELQSGDGGRTVVLCRGCREKLANIIEDVVAATESGASADGDTSDERGLEETGFEPIGTSDDTDSTDTGRFGDEATPADSGGLLDSGDSTATDDRDTPADGQVAADDASDSGDSAADGTAAPGETDESDGPSLTRLEYNKVMRLLQNREFPVDRAEIREVATSAYQISPAEFDAVIEAAIERDLIAERNGQFVTPG